MVWNNEITGTGVGLKCRTLKNADFCAITLQSVWCDERVVENNWLPIEVNQFTSLFPIKTCQQVRKIVQTVQENWALMVKNKLPKLTAVSPKCKLDLTADLTWIHFLRCVTTTWETCRNPKCDRYELTWKVHCTAALSRLTQKFFMIVNISELISACLRYSTHHLFITCFKQCFAI